MKKLIQRTWKNEKGFTLIELIIVIAILAIISAVAIPNILSAVDNSRRTSDVQNAATIASQAAIIKTSTDEYAVVTGTFTFDVATNQITGPADVAPSTLNADFADDLEAALSNRPVLPRFRGTGGPTVANSYYRVVLSNAAGDSPITVFIGPVADARQLYPIVNANYVNQ